MNVIASLGSKVREGFEARVAVLVLAAIGLLGPLSAQNGPLNAYFGGAFELNDVGSCPGAGPFVSMLTLSLSAFLGVIGCIVAINLIREHSSERTRLAAPSASYQPSVFWFMAGSAAAVSIVCYAHFQTGAHPACTDDGFTLKLAGSVLGLILASIFALVAFYVQFWFTDSNVRADGPTYLVIPFDRIPLIGPKLKAWADRAWTSTPPPGLPNLTFESVPAWLRPGLFFQDREGKWHLYSGHLFATAMGIFSLAIWWGLGYAKQLFIAPPTHLPWFQAMLKSRIHPFHLQDTPTLVFVIAFLLVANWGLSGLCFLFDRYRVPLLVIIAVLAWSTGQDKNTDFVYRVVNKQRALAFPAPASLFADKLKDGKVPIVIATAGGGIQAAAWTVKVVSELEQQVPNFKNHIALVSSVSGGSIGATYLGAAWSGVSDGRKNLADEDTACQDTVGLARANCLVRRSSLDDVAWGLFNPDVWRAIQPFFRDPKIDRGWALEERLSTRTGLKYIDLSDWAELARSGLMPAFIFNSTAVEYGWPVALGTSDFPSANNDMATIRKVKSFAHLLGNADTAPQTLRVVTAARLSATFPYVSPSARADLPGQFPTAHLADGGYYDNYGLLSAMDWLYEGMTHSEPRRTDAPVQRIAIIEIKNYPDSESSHPNPRGWGYQLWGPIDTLLNAKDTSQLGQDQAQLCSFRRHWREHGYEIRSFDFSYPKDPQKTCAKQPVSWKLNSQQNSCIDDMWNERSAEIQRLVEFLRGDPVKGNADDPCSITNQPEPPFPAHVKS